MFDQTLSKDKYEIIVVDNASTDATANVLARISSFHKNLIYIKESAIGRSHARNCGIRAARGELILLLDDDIEIDRDHLHCHVAYHRSSSQNLAVIGRVLDVSPIRPKWLQDYFHSRQLAGAKPPASLSQRNLGAYFITQSVSLKRSILDSISTGTGDDRSYFDAAFFMREDGDLGYRLLDVGVRFLFPDNILCNHHHPRTFASAVRRSYEAGYDLVRFFKKHPKMMGSARYMTESRLLNIVLLISCYALFPVGWLFRPISPPFAK